MKRDVARLCRKSDVREPLILMDDGGEGLTEKVEEWLEKKQSARKDSIPGQLYVMESTWLKEEQTVWIKHSPDRKRSKTRLAKP